MIRNKAQHTVTVTVKIFQKFQMATTVFFCTSKLSTQQKTINDVERKCVEQMLVTKCTGGHKRSTPEYEALAAYLQNKLN